MITFSKTIEKPNYLFGLLPNYFKENDTYVPNEVLGFESEGFLERYLGGLCSDIDSELSPYLDNIGYLYDATGLSNLPHSDYNKFLIHISDMMGNPPDIGTEELYAILLRYLVHILRVKGTRLSLDLYLVLFGYKVKDMTITPYMTPIYDHLPTPYKYDDGYVYDTMDIFYFDLDLVITDYNGMGPLDPGSPWLLKLREALGNFIMPIYINLISVTYEP